jgi:23S rRNA (cytidine2498-2'-O)-methyltransferase
LVTQLKGPARVFVGTPGFERAVIAEVAPALEAAIVVPGVVAGSEPGTDLPVDPAFARQVLPDTAEVTGASVRALAEAAYASVEGTIDRWDGPFTLHAFPPPVAPAAGGDTTLPAARLTHTRARAARRGGARDAPARNEAGAGLGSRATLVGSALLELLGERRKRASRRHVAGVVPGTFDARVLLVQLLLADRERLLVSAAPPRPLPRGGFDLAPWPAGDAPVAEDRAPPSRAYRKLEEAFQWMGAAPRAGEACVDLGAAPGSWTYAAARRRARVVALDRAPLAPVVARLPGVSTLAGDAFTYAPPSPVDWLLSDIISEPARAIALVDDWLSAKRARNLVVTIKFKGRDQYGALSALAPIFDRTSPRFARVKQLAHNKNEVTVMVRL